jgi:hypothetical protein
MYSSLLASTTLTIWKALEYNGYSNRDLFKQAGLDPQALH